jgi:beta-RFAP synthase
MRRVRTASRLHFGLLSLAAEGEHWADREGRVGLPARRFGGVGLMVERPGLVVRATPAPAWSAEGPLAGRALAFARRFAETCDRDGPPLRLSVEQGAPEHAGLGTGTQLALAVARLLASTWGQPCDTPELARRVGRGLRSALGTHGFAQGGFLVEAGQAPTGGLAPLVARVTFPEEWRLVLALPEQGAGLHGAAERQAFTLLARSGEQETESLCRLVLLGLLPALVEKDLEAFSAALFDFNVLVGEMFAPVQGGLYAGSGAAALVEFLRACGVQGVGQSSWGPAVFAVVADEDRAQDLTGHVRARFGLNPERVWVTRACNRGAREEFDPLGL